MIVSNYAIRFRIAVFVFIVVLILAGVGAYVRLPREGAPDVTIPYVFVTAVYEGTAPTEIEKLVTIPLERQFNDLEGVKQVTSTSDDSVSFFEIEFLSGVDMDLGLQRVKSKIDLARPDLPNDLDEPITQAINFSTDFPILVLALSGEADNARLKQLAAELQDQLELIPGVRQAAVAGVREREIRVNFDPRRLAAYGLPIEQIIGRVQAENTTISAGHLEMSPSKLQVRLPGEFEWAAELGAIPLAVRDGRAIYLRDVAEITDTHKDLDSISRLNGAASVSISILKRSGVNSVRAIEAVKQVLDAFPMPPGIALTIVSDQSDDIAMMIAELENNIVTGFSLVVVVLLLFMGLRNALFVAAAIPLSMLIAFVVLEALGFSLNMIVLFSLVLAVGMLVDNAIVIVENIYRNHCNGLNRVEAARQGAGEVAWPVITSTLTTLAAFSPLLFWPDIMGQFMGFLPRTLLVVLTASLFVALVINPAVCSALIGGRPETAARSSGFRNRFVDGYERLLRGALHHRLAVLLLGIAFLAFSITLYARFGEGLELFPDVEPRNCTIDVQYPQGTPIARTDATLQAIEDRIEGLDDVRFTLATVGRGGGGFLSGGAGGGHRGSITVEFVKQAERTTNSFALVDHIRELVGEIPGAEVKVDRQREGPPLGAPISIQIAGEDFEVLTAMAQRITRAIETVPGLVDLVDDFEDALPELQFIVDRDRAAAAGLDTSQLGTYLRAAIYGLEISKYRADEEEYDLTLRAPLEQRAGLALFEEAYLALPDGARVPLQTLGETVYTGGRGAIRRKDRKRVITLTANVETRGVDEVLTDIRARIADLSIPRGYTVIYEGDTKEMRESGAFLQRAFLIAVGLIFVVLVIQFNSALIPFIILFTVVLSMIGVMWGLLLTRMRFGVIMTGVGVISLAGIVVNNAIVLLDCINQRRRDDQLPTHEAVVAAGRLRLRPVLLTAITTILGLIPMAIGYSVEIHEFPPRLIAGAESSQWWAPMAVAVIFGLALSTMLTLALVPVMYSLADDLARRFHRKK
ncbi:MAG: efflux RND transporter permease subunit [Candidatus Marinimicrobia bacterium]|nr:efflux RND transporter permease subunit [Candidatus Neomarinimicrobiota bacterium]